MIAESKIGFNFYNIMNYSSIRYSVKLHQCALKMDFARLPVFMSVKHSSTV